jgi:hypothetical protein
MSLEERVRLIEEERAILATLYTYGHSIDYGLEEEFLDCFVAEAVLSYTPKVANRLVATGRVERSFVGREQIAGFFRNHTHAPDLYHKHFLVEPRIQIDGDHASATSYFARLDESAEGPVLSSFGRYRDELVRCPDGRWRFARREGSTESRVPA